MVHKRMTKWDNDIIANIVRSIERRTDLTPEGKVEMIRELKSEYKRMRMEGWTPEQILDKFSGQAADTRWIYWLKSYPEYGG
jgi:hypothetical protein